MAKKRRFELQRWSWHNATFQNGRPVEIKSTMVKQRRLAGGVQGLPGVPTETQTSGWLVLLRHLPAARSFWLHGFGGQDGEGANLPLLRWHGGGEHRDSKQAKLAISDVFLGSLLEQPCLDAREQVVEGFYSDWAFGQWRKSWRWKL